MAKQIVAVGHSLNMRVCEFTTHRRCAGIVVGTQRVRLVSNAYTAEVQGWQREGWQHNPHSGTFPNGTWTQDVETGASATK